MVKQRVVSSNYLGVGLAIATGFVANLGLSLQAQAQVDPNIQSRLDILLPPISAQMPTGGVATNPDLTFITTNTASGCVSTEVLRSLAAKLKLLKSLNGLTDKDAHPLTEQEIARNLTTQEIKQTVEGYFNRQQANTDAQKQLVETSLAPVKPKPCDSRQPVNVQLSFPFNPTYETNVLKSGNNGIPGESAGFGGNMLVTAGVEGRPWDIVVFSGGEASARYTPNFSPSVDGLSSQASYQLFLHAYGYNVSNVGDAWHKTFVDNLVPGSLNMPPPGMMTFDTLAFGVQNQTAFAPTFRYEKSDFLTPQVTIARQNIGLDDLNAKPCKDSQNLLQYCTYASFSLTAGESFADVKTLQNANFAASATLGWNITPSWSLTLPATATAKDYEDVVGGRRDVLLQVGPVLSYTTSTFPMCSLAAAKNAPIICSEESAKYTFSLPVTYYKNYSTISADAWSGWVIMPTLTIAFNYASD